MAAPQGLFGLGGMTPQEMQAQIDQAKALEYAKLTQDQRYAMAGATGGTMFGRGVQGLLGGGPTYDPTVRKAKAQEEILKSVDPADPKSFLVAAKVAQDQGDFETAYKLTQRFSEAMEKKGEQDKREAEIAKLKAEEEWKKAQTATEKSKGSAKDLAQEALKTGKYTPASIRKYLKTENVADLELVDKENTQTVTVDGEVRLIHKGTGETIKVLGRAKPSAMETFADALAAERAEAARLQRLYDQEKNEAKRNEMKVNWHKGVQANVFALNKTEDAKLSINKALKLAPKTALGAMIQAAGDLIPWTDQKALANIVGTLQADKVLGTLRDLKSQSATGATGFGALSEKELDLIIKDITALDPTDKNFKDQLNHILKKLGETEEALKASRAILEETRPGGPKPSGTGEQRKTASGLIYTVVD